MDGPDQSRPDLETFWTCSMSCLVLVQGGSGLGLQGSGPNPWIIWFWSRVVPGSAFNTSGPGLWVFLDLVQYVPDLLQILTLSSSQISHVDSQGFPLKSYGPSPDLSLDLTSPSLWASTIKSLWFSLQIRSIRVCDTRGEL